MRPDLRLHVLAGIGWGGAVAAAASYWVPAAGAILLGILGGLTVGWLKELVWDKLLGKGQFDPDDAHYTVIGATVGAIVAGIVFPL